MWKRGDGSENMVDFLDLVGDVEHQMATIMWWFTHVQSATSEWWKMGRTTSDERVSIFRQTHVIVQKYIDYYNFTAILFPKIYVYIEIYAIAYIIEWYWMGVVQRMIGIWKYV